jgi:isopentenyl-diphosphate delta-isomerase
MKTTRTSSRKKEHVALAIKKNVAFKGKTTGFERWDFQHNALPECNESDIDTETIFLGKKTALPFIIASMTGGYGEALTINRHLAEFCAEKRLAMGVGSQRQVLDNEMFARSFSVVREISKDIPLFGNIGAAEVARMKELAPFQRLADLIGADGFAVHLNPLQEFLQPEGNTNFAGVLKGIERLVKGLPIPILVKEIGAGISGAVARRLLETGVSIIDVAGAGGTSWAGIEIMRRKSASAAESESLSRAFWDWGIPTAEALRDAAQLRSEYPLMKIIASGGISSGLDAAKSIAFGADYAGIARPVLKAWAVGGKRGLDQFIKQWEREFRGAMFLTGSQTIFHLQQQLLVSR